MAVKWIEDAGVTRTAHGYSVAPENVVINETLSGRMDATDIEELAHDIEANGQLENAVCWKNETGWPVLAAGHRRYRAIQKINSTRKAEQHIRLQFSFVDAKTEQEAFDYTVRENRNRVNPSPLDDAHNMHVYATRFGLSVEQIAQKYYPGANEEALEKAVREVNNCLALLQLSPEAQEELRKGFFSTSAGLQLAAIPSRKKQNEVIEKAKAEGKEKILVSEAKAAKEEAVGPAKTRNRPTISDNSPVALLKRFKVLAELAGALAAEVGLEKNPDKDVVKDLAGSILIGCKNLNIPLLAKADTWAEKHKDDELPPGLRPVSQTTKAPEPELVEA